MPSRLLRIFDSPSANSPLSFARMAIADNSSEKVLVFDDILFLASAAKFTYNESVDLYDRVSDSIEQDDIEAFKQITSEYINKGVQRAEEAYLNFNLSELENIDLEERNKILLDTYRQLPAEKKAQLPELEQIFQEVE